MNSIEKENMTKAEIMIEEAAKLRAETPTTHLGPKCTSCGTAIREGANFCHRCGAKVA